MSANPTIVLDAINEAPVKHGSVTINPVTISRYALLELVESPFVMTDRRLEVNSVIPSVYILAADKSTIRQYRSGDVDKLKADAFDWADENMELTELPDVIRDIVRRFAQVNDAAPEGVPDQDGKKK